MFMIPREYIYVILPSTGRTISGYATPVEINAFTFLTTVNQLKFI